MLKIWTSIAGILLCLSVKFSETGKILAALPSVELSDYRFGLGDPYIMLYERENFRGKVHFHRIGLRCTNIQEKYQNWASSVDVQRRCVTLCDQLDCQGNCQRISHSPLGTISKLSKGANRLSDHNLNDKVASVKFCY